jgi:hypothetical protein
MNTAAPPPAPPANHTTPMTDLEAFLTLRLRLTVDYLADI